MILYALQILLQSISTVIAAWQWWRYRSAFWLCIGGASGLMVARRVTALLAKQGLHVEAWDRLFLPLAISVLITLAAALAGIFERDKRRRQLIEDNSIEFCSIGAAYIGLDGRPIRVNQHILDIWERTEEEVLSEGFTWQSITPEPDLSDDLALLQKLTQKVIDCYTLSKRYTMPSGVYKWCRLTVWRVEDSDGRVSHYSIHVMDIGMERRLEEILNKIGDVIEGL